MSKSPRKTSRTARGAGPPRSTPRRATGPAVDVCPPPRWAIAAIRDLVVAEMAFDLMARDVAGWPEGRRRVQNARRYLRDVARGRTPRAGLVEDVWFAASLMARICDADLGLGVSETVAILDQLGLPTDVVPIVPRDQPSMRLPVHPEIVPLRPRPAGASAAPRPCEECGFLPLYRNAA